MVDLFGRSCFHFRDRCIVRLNSLMDVLLGFDLPVPSCLSLARRHTTCHGTRRTTLVCFWMIHSPAITSIAENFGSKNN